MMYTYTYLALCIHVYLPIFTYNHTSSVHTITGKYNALKLYTNAIRSYLSHTYTYRYTQTHIPIHIPTHMLMIQLVHQCYRYSRLQC